MHGSKDRAVALGNYGELFTWWPNHTQAIAGVGFWFGGEESAHCPYLSVPVDVFLCP